MKKQKPPPKFADIPCIPYDQLSAYNYDNYVKSKFKKYKVLYFSGPDNDPRYICLGCVEVEAMDEESAGSLADMEAPSGWKERSIALA